jgi:hypothetical protein
MRTCHWRIWGAAVSVVAATVGADAQQVDDPDWPCVQRKVPELSVGQMWTGPVPGESWRQDAELLELARRLAPRRVPIETIQAEADGYVGDLEGEARAERLAELFAAVLRQINAERGQVIAGIARYAQRQAGFSEQIGALQRELAQLEQAPEDQGNPARVRELEDALAWETRIFRERAQSLTYVCEAPVLLEQRAFAIARALNGLL